MIDHLFVMTERGAPAADRLVAAGLTEGPPNTHPGQGTANRRFFFDNGMVELLWIEDETEAASVPELGLIERANWRTTGASRVWLQH